MINIINISRAYSEVYEFINALGDEYKNKIPKQLYVKIKEQRDKNYVPKYDINQESADFSNEALSLISAINLQYWCEDSEEKERLKKVYTDNTQKEEQKYSYENLFKSNKAEKQIQEEQPIENVQMIEYKEKNVFNRILNKIKTILDKVQGKIKGKDKRNLL